MDKSFILAIDYDGKTYVGESKISPNESFTDNHILLNFVNVYLTKNMIDKASNSGTPYGTYLLNEYDSMLSGGAKYKSNTTLIQTSRIPIEQAVINLLRTTITE